MSSLRDYGALANGDPGLVVNDRAVRDGGFVTALKVPRCPDNRAGINVTLSPELRAENSKQKSAPRVEEPRRWPKQQNPD
jgi:hypothetical protein